MRWMSAIGVSREGADESVRREKALASSPLAMAAITEGMLECEDEVDGGGVGCGDEMSWSCSN